MSDLSNLTAHTPTPIEAVNDALFDLVAEMERNLRSDVVRWTENANLPARQWVDRARVLLAARSAQ